MISVSYGSLMVKVFKSGQIIWSKKCNSWYDMVSSYDEVVKTLRALGRLS